MGRTPYNDHECIRLRWDAPGHGGGEGYVDPHPLPQITKTHRQAGLVQDNGIVIYIQLKLFYGSQSIWHGRRVGDYDISGVPGRKRNVLHQRIVDPQEIALPDDGTSVVVSHLLPHEKENMFIYYMTSKPDVSENGGKHADQEPEPKNNLNKR